MSKEFQKISEYIDRLMRRLVKVYSSFEVYETLRELRAPNLVGEDIAEKNLTIINGYGGLFNSILEPTKKFALLELAKFFDYSKQALSLAKLRNCAEGDKGKLAAVDFEKVNEDRYAVEDLTQAYEGINTSDLKHVDELFRNNEELIDRLIKYRDTRLCHDDIGKPVVSLSVSEVKALFEIVEEILQLFSDKLKFSTWEFKPLKESVKEDVVTAIEHLQQFRQDQLDEMDG